MVDTSLMPTNTQIQSNEGVKTNNRSHQRFSPQMPRPIDIVENDFGNIEICCIPITNFENSFEIFAFVCIPIAIFVILENSFQNLETCLQLVERSLRSVAKRSLALFVDTVGVRCKRNFLFFSVHCNRI